MEQLNEKQKLEEQFNELFEKAKEAYPNIEDSIATYSKVCQDSKTLSEYLSITYPEPLETTSNHVS